MNKLLRIVLIIALITSPFWIGILATLNEPPDSVAGLVVLVYLIFGVPLIAIIGFISSIIVKKNNVKKLSLAGYAIPALIICGWEFFVTLS